MKIVVDRVILLFGTKPLMLSRDNFIWSREMHLHNDGLRFAAIGQGVYNKTAWIRVLLVMGSMKMYHMPTFLDFHISCADSLPTLQHGPRGGQGLCPPGGGLYCSRASGLPRADLAAAHSGPGDPQQN